VALIRVRRYLLMYFTPETLLNHVFEDLRKPKAPNRHAGPVLGRHSVEIYTLESPISLSYNIARSKMATIANVLNSSPPNIP
jgi:hypothetical protein